MFQRDKRAEPNEPRKAPAQNEAGSPHLRPDGEWSRLRQLGNMAALGIQPKLRVNQPDDAYEREADRIADAVVGMNAPPTDTQGASKPARPQIRANNSIGATNIVNRQGTSGNTNDVAPQVENYVRPTLGGGRALTPTERNFFEPRMGADFSQVRIHEDSDAATSATGLLNGLQQQHLVFQLYSPPLSSPQGISHGSLMRQTACYYRVDEPMCSSISAKIPISLSRRRNL